MSRMIDKNNSIDLFQEMCPADKLCANPGTLYIRHSGWLRENDGFRCNKINREYNLHFVVSGRGKVIVDDVEHEMAAGDAFMFYPGHRTEHFDLPGERWEYYWVALRAPEGMLGILNSALAATGLSESSPRLEIPSRSELWSFVPKLHRHFRDGSYGGLFPMAAAWRILDAMAYSGKAAQIPLSERVRNYVDSMDGAVGVKELAVKFGVSRATLHRVFSGSYGESLKSHMQECRFKGACELLEGSMLDVRQVAAATGFASAQYFCRAFKAKFGTSPGQWRLEKAQAL